MSPMAPVCSGAEAVLDAYAAQAGHQLGEAVALLRGYLVVLEQRVERDPELDDAVRGLSAGTERAQRFVDDLLDLAAAGRAEPAAELVSLDEALETARRRLAGELQDAGTEVRAGSLPVVRADRELVARLLAHLLRVALAAGARSVEVEAAEESGGVRVAVRDDGTPAGDEDPFAPFARARGRGPLVGAGVGLTVSRRLVGLHGGTITLGQEPDGTTLVTFTLPAEGTQLVRVLLCDDTAELRSLLRYALESGGGLEIVAEVGDGDVAVQLAADEQPDVVVLDLEMPGPEPEALLNGLRRAAPNAALVTFSGHEPAAVAGAAVEEIALHVPKTTDLAAAARAVRSLRSDRLRA